MATESPMRIMPGLNSSTSGGTSGQLEASDIRLLRERARYDHLNGGNDVFMQRSESAPPSVEGSLAALQGVLGNRFGVGGGGYGGDGDGDSEQNARSDPAYLEYYHKHVNLNPRLPPPLPSSDLYWRRSQLGGGTRDKWKLPLRSLDDNNSRSLFSNPILRNDDELQVHEEELDDEEHSGPMAHGFGSRARSVVDLIQKDFPRTPSPVYAFTHDAAATHDDPSSVEMQLMHLQEMAALGSSSASAQLDAPIPDHAGRRSPFDAPISDHAGRRSPFGPAAPTRSASTEPTVSSGTFADVLKNTTSAGSDLTAALQSLSMSETGTSNIDAAARQQVRDERDTQGHGQLRYRQQRHQPAPQRPQPRSYTTLEEQMQYLQSEAAAQAAAAAQPGLAAAALAAYLAAGGTPFPQPSLYGNPYTYPPLYYPGGYDAAARARAAFDRPLYHQGDAVQDAMYLQYLQRAADGLAMRNFAAQSEADLAYLAEHKLQYPRAYKANPLYYGGRPGVPYYNSALPRDPLAALRSGLVYGWRGGDEEVFRGSPLLEEYKSNKSRRFELPDIVGHVVEFSADQHGSRFIQQKLETATTEEKAQVFEEVLPAAFSLMTDVFGNYVIQKFFEHGSSEQRRELAKLLIGHMLELSLQMYGCRVIQKALEVCDLDQQEALVAELDGHVMRCVRDQNGNHVIQKCIECVPPDKIQFIISAFYGHVLTLSMHPYGCRVIQRVLEHCTDDQKQAGIMKEILGATCNLAQDQYGNYVIQHVLEHGKPHERSEIITKLAGQIVQMSQHKFASNVVEKCLEFGGPAERQILVDEMLGTTDENAPLQAMMKDQFANYVVQKVLETCSDQQREMLLGRIKVHLHALKKYTYGKHIVARVEKLVAAGERRGAAVASAASASAASASAALA